ncbi:TMEM175 family protein [Kitasatospora sp. NBC_01287]|uniref:TMEM175 family protein n=1 Tax=Kitasatospora sp. NBC_01287 TaxID=2903573 RepID=UPI00224CB40E|nr:TMEM175 family protein [Kitasatospora sp. NBC_01287]MCX4750733.1 TMEM175 family protein [Kitasatospora sp. NBC_01287]
MANAYHRIVGGSVHRLAAISDGIFAVAMTLLVLDLHVPAIQLLNAQHTLWAPGAGDGEAQLWHALARLAPHLGVFVLGFLTLGMFWLGQQAQLDHLARGDRHLTWIHLAFLCAVSLMPFSTALLAAYETYRVALLVYWLHLLTLGLLLLAALRYAERAALFREDAPAGLVAAARRRIVVAQTLYAAAVLLGLVNTYLSVALIILLQLNSAIAPNLKPLNQF